MSVITMSPQQILLNDIDFSLYPHQQEMIKRVYRYIRNGKRRILCQLATGGGKSRIIQKIAYDALSRGRRVLIVAHRDELVKQLFNTITAITSPLNIGIIKAGYEMDLSCAIQVAGLQTLSNRWHFIQYQFDLVIIDEGHHGTAPSYREIYDRNPSAVTLWFTATPENERHEVTFEDICDEIVTGDSLGASVAEMIASGVLRDFDIYVPERTIDTSAIAHTGFDFDIRELSEKARDPGLVADAPAMWRKYCNGRRTAVFTVDVAHSLAVVDEFRKAGIWAEEINAKTPKSERRDKIVRFIRGEYLVLVNIGIFTEGFDLATYAELENLPSVSIDAVQFLRPTESLPLYLQMAGRGLRQSTEFKRAIFLDHAGVTDKFGDPDFPFKWSLQGAIKECPNCGSEIKRTLMECPKCSYDFSKPQEEQESEDLDMVAALKEKSGVEHDKAKELVLKQRDLMSQFLRFQAIADEERKPRSFVWSKVKSLTYRFGELHATGSLLGYKPFWIYHQWLEHNEARDPSWMPTLEELEEVRKTLTTKEGKAYHNAWPKRQLSIMQENRLNGKPLLGEKK